MITCKFNITSELRLNLIGQCGFFRNFPEKCLTRFIVGPLRLNLCSGFFHRMSSLRTAISSYDYLPYCPGMPPKPFQELSPPTEDDFDAFNENISIKHMHVTLINPVIEIELMDHPYFVATKEQYFIRPKKVCLSLKAKKSYSSFSFKRMTMPTTDSDSSNEQKEVPKLTLECQSIEAKFSSPTYEEKLVTTTCQLPEAPQHMFDACHDERTIKFIGICSRLILGPNRKYTTLIMPTNATYSSKVIIYPDYWLSNDIIHKETTFESGTFLWPLTYSYKIFLFLISDAITITGTNPKLTLAYHILKKLYRGGLDENYAYIKYSSLFDDAARDFCKFKNNNLYRQMLL